MNNGTRLEMESGMAGQAVAIPKMFYCDRLGETVTRAGCVQRQDLMAAERSELLGCCLWCDTGAVQRLVLQMETAREVEHELF